MTIQCDGAGERGPPLRDLPGTHFSLSVPIASTSAENITSTFAICHNSYCAADAIKARAGAAAASTSSNRQIFGRNYRSVFNISDAVRE